MLLILLRGISGTGKSYLAKKLKKIYRVPVFSTDDYFMEKGKYCWNYSKLSENHKKNLERTLEAMKHRQETIIVDNTNTQAWEMKPYVKFALRYGYDVKIEEPAWSPKLKDKEDKWNIYFILKLQQSKERKDQNKSFSREILEKMRNKYEYDLTLLDILNSKTPNYVNKRED